MPMKLMVVDDDPVALELARALVEPLDYEVLALEDSRHAAECVNEQKFDCIFVDVQMPNMDGFELTRIIRASRLNSGAPIVMITAFDDVETMRRGFKAGVTFFLTKPFIPDKMRGLLHAMSSAILRERRHSIRLPVSMTVKCRSGNEQTEMTSVNISESGMLLRSPKALESGHEVNLEFAFSPGQEHLSVRAKIVHKEPPDLLGVQFLDLTSDDQETIRQYISSGLEEEISDV